jgi:hypothetical protein
MGVSGRRAISRAFDRIIDAGNSVPHYHLTSKNDEDPVTLAPNSRENNGNGGRIRDRFPRLQPPGIGLTIV